MNNQVKTIFLLGALSVLLTALGGALGQNYLYTFVIVAVVMNFVSYFYSDKIVLAMNHAREISMAEAPKLHSIVEELAARADIPKPRVFIIPQPQPNAFATGRDPEHGAVAVTEGILRLLPERELRGVLAHELSHIKNRDILISSVAATLASAITFIAHAVRWGALFGGYGSREDRGGTSPLGLLAMAIVAPFAALLIQLGISRSREFAADASGAQISGDPESLARALEHLHEGVQAIPASVAPATASMYIVNPFTGSSLMSLFSTHPPVEERVAKLRGLLLDPARMSG